jgi:hypothetical protein
MNPHEAALLGAILADPEIIASQSLTADLFTSEPAARLFKAACRVMEQGLFLDPIALADSLRAQGMDPKAAAVLAASIEPSSAANAEFYRDHLAEARDRAKLKATLRQALEGLDTPGTDLARITEGLRGTVDTPRRPQGFTFTRADRLDFKAPEWSVYRFLPQSGFGVAFGKFGTLKSFLTLDLAFSIATGLPWHGHSVRRGSIAVIAGEGYAGFVLRKTAWEKARNMSLEGAPVYFSSQAARLGDEGFYSQARAALEYIHAEAGCLTWIVVDTWSRNLCGDENSSADSAAAVADLDRLRAPFGAGILVVHHEGWTAGRTRGSTVLMSASDFAYRCERADDGILRVTCEKMKDGATPEPLAFELVDHDLGLVDEEGRPVKSAALERIDYEPASRKVSAPNQLQALEILQTLYAEHRANLANEGRQPDARVRWEDFRKAMVEAGMSRQRISDSKKGLLDSGLIELDGIHVRLMSAVRGYITPRTDGHSTASENGQSGQSGQQAATEQPEIF